MLDGNTDLDYNAEQHGGKEGELSENAGSTEPELAIHAFLTKPVQIFHIKVSQAYPGMGKRLLAALQNLFDDIVLCTVKGGMLQLALHANSNLNSFFFFLLPCYQLHACLLRNLQWSNNNKELH